ncbi:MAG: hypothetical protein ABII13_05260 [Patescibacteria group bacterium]|nr:hypothetical protein [Patescibacteria group bacterium]MBU2509050.1 hypothetical protein [Patescibacteria group bacterium]
MQEPVLLPVSSLQQIEADPLLYKRIVNAINAARLRKIRTRLILALCGFMASAAYVVSSLSIFWQELRASSFFEYIRLATTDSDIVFANARNYFTGLLETIPAETALIVCVCSLFFIALIALADAWRSLKNLTLIHSSATNS